MFKNLIYALGISVAVCCLGAVALGQVTTGTIYGTVEDTTGAVLPGTEVSLSSIETGIRRSTITDDEGRYRASNLALGTYEVTASLPGFQTAVRSGITLTIGREAIVNFKLTVGEITERVTVTGEAPLVQTTSGSLGELVDRETILELPLNGRDLADLMTLQAGTSLSTTVPDGTNTGFGKKISVSGARPYDNSILIDGTEVKGVDATVPAGVAGGFVGAEAVQEFKIERNSYSAQYGGGVGGVVNVVSKAGTNQFHGSLYEFHRNDNLDASNFREPIILDTSGNFIGKDKPEFKRNQFGFSLGGPIIKNRTFVFGNYEGLRQRFGSTIFLRTFTQATRQGLLPDPNTGELLPVALNPDVVPYFDLWPLPGALAEDLGDGTTQESVGRNVPTEEDFYQIRVDHNFSEADSAFVRVTRQTSDTSNPGAIPQWSLSNFQSNMFVTIQEQKIFSPQLLNTFRFGFNRHRLGSDAFEDPVSDPSLHFVPASAWRAPLGAPLVQGEINVSGVSGVGIGRGWADRKINRFQYIDDVVYNRGAHSWKFGINWQRLQYNGDNPSRPAGQFSFSSVEDFLAGIPSRFRGDILPQTDSIRGMRYHIIEWYVQDDWQVHPQLTLNLGFRHGFFTVPTEVNGKLANLRKPFVDTVIATGDPWFENASLKSFMPRIGLAWDPTGSGKTAIRAGFGIFYNHIFPDTFEQAIFRTAPFALETNLRSNIPFPNIFDPVVQQGLGDADLHLFPFDYGRNPHMLQWNLNIQREVFAQTSVTVGYAGSRGLNLIRRVNLNTPLAENVNGRLVFPVGAQLPNPFWDLDLTSREMSADSWYHSFQSSFQRRFRSGFQVQLAYTYARTMDTESQFNNDFSGATPQYPYYHDLDMRKGLAQFDVRHTFAASYVWELPLRLGNGPSGLMEKILAGWQLGGIVTLASGPPVNIDMSRRSDFSALSVGYDFPDLAPGANNNPVLKDPDQYYDTSAFVPPPSRTFGNLGRNTVIAPGIANFDFSLTKRTAISEAADVQFRFEAFNMFNRPNLSAPENTVFDSRGRPQGNAGFISSTTTTSRQLQFALRVIF